jgi:hypothetical protein
MTTKDFILTVENELKDFSDFGDGISEVVQVWYCKPFRTTKDYLL